MPIFNPPSVPSYDLQRVIHGGNGDCGDQDPPVWHLQAVPARSRERTGIGAVPRRRQQDSLAVDFHVGDAFLAPAALRLLTLGRWLNREITSLRRP